MHTDNAARVLPDINDLDRDQLLFKKTPDVSANSVSTPTGKSTGTVKSWVWEIVSGVVSLISFVSIIVVLRIYDQKALPTWPLGITLNTFLALCTTICKACFMIPVAEAICQWKWNIYNDTDGHSLHDFHVIDLASRGVWGSIWLVGRFKWRHAMTVAGVVSILSALSSPVTQQALNYPTHQVRQADFGTVSINRNWTDWYSVNLDFGKALQRGLEQSLDNPVKPLAATCPTANCTFPAYRSLAVCMKMANVTEYLNVTTLLNSTHEEWSIGLSAGNSTVKAYNASLPNGVNLVAPEWSWSLIGRTAYNSVVYGDDDANFGLLANQFVIHMQPRDGGYFGIDMTPAMESQFGAFEVLIYLCVNEYQTTVYNGNSSTKIISSTVTPVQDDIGKRIPRFDCRYPSGTSQSLTSPSCNETVHNLTFEQRAFADPDAQGGNYSFAWWFTTTVSELLNERMFAVTSLMGTAEDAQGGMRGTRNTPALEDVLWGPYMNRTNLAPEDRFLMVEAYYGGIATAVTNFFRADQWSPLVSGTAWRDETYVNVRWGWLAFLAVELLLSSVFLLFTMIATRRIQVPVLKSSPLAPLLATNSEVQEGLGTLLDLDAAEKRARSLNVKLERGRFELA